ncbi:hypothetical protein OV834_24370, partial [Salmonella enterica subsp. enterica serovar 1,4,[5],12:i:-]|nr:hypothetical protein [Salmonella sp. L-S2806]MCY6048500.1 hypothetical protein [Salmonella enterica subsp. enterica serovar 1,4,[5],12:i:-]
CFRIHYRQELRLTDRSFEKSRNQGEPSALRSKSGHAGRLRKIIASAQCVRMFDTFFARSHSTQKEKAKQMFATNGNRVPLYRLIPPRFHARVKLTS